MLPLGKEQWKNDVTCTTWQPDGQEQEDGNKHDHQRAEGVSKAHSHVEQRSCGAQEDVSGVGEPGLGPKTGDGDSNEGQGINQPPMLEKAKVDAPVGKFEQIFAEVWNHTVAESSDADGAEIADEDGCPEASFGVQPIHSSSDHGAEQDVQRVKDLEELVGERAGNLNLLNDHYYDNAQQGSEYGERSVRPELFADIFKRRSH